MITSSYQETNPAKRIARGNFEQKLGFCDPISDPGAF
jgi:hypothetical protein